MKILFSTIFIVIFLVFTPILALGFSNASSQKLDEELISKIITLTANTYHKYLITKDKIYHGRCIYGIEFESTGVNIYNAKFRLSVIERLKTDGKTLQIDTYTVRRIKGVRFSHKYDLFAEGVRFDLEEGWVIIVVDPEINRNIIWVITEIISEDRDEALQRATQITKWICQYVRGLYNQEKKDLDRLKLQDIRDLNAIIKTKIPTKKEVKSYQIQKQTKLKFNYQDILLANQLTKLAQDEIRQKEFSSKIIKLSNENRLFNLILAAIYTLMDIYDFQKISDNDVQLLVETVWKGEFKKAESLLKKLSCGDIRGLFKNFHPMSRPKIKGIEKKREPIWNPDSVMYLKEADRLLKFLKLQGPVTIAVIDNNFYYGAVPEDMWMVKEDVNENGILDRGDINWKDDDNDGKADNFIGEDFFRRNLGYYHARLLNINPVLNNIDLTNIFTGVGHGSFVSNIIYNTPGSEYIKIYPIRIMDYIIKEQRRRGPAYELYLTQLAQAIDYASRKKGIKIINISSGTPLIKSYGAGASDINKILTSIQEKSLVIASSGNIPSPKKESILARHESTLIVGASTINPKNKKEDIARFTTTGKNLDLLAPGVNIPTNITGVGETLVDGTSFATPFVAKLAAIILAINPQFTFAQIKDLIISSSDKILASNGHSYNRVNFLRTIMKAVETSAASY